MEFLDDVFNIIKPAVWLASVGLQDAYHTSLERWVKQPMIAAGIDTSSSQPHSCGVASTSNAKSAGNLSR